MNQSKFLFDDPKKVEELRRELEEWIGTPWRHRVAVKGLGADCIYFVAGVFHNLKVFNFEIAHKPDYPPDWHLHNTRELLMETIKRSVPVVEISLDEIRNGDIILSHYGKAASHASIYLDGFLYHCIHPGGVIKASFDDRNWREKMRFALRILK